jgi:hypothetical protein
MFFVLRTEDTGGSIGYIEWPKQKAFYGIPILSTQARTIKGRKDILIFR